MRKLILSTLLAVLMVGCDDFGSTNVNPNSPSNPRTDLLMTQAQKSIGDNVGSVTGTLYVQYFSETQYTDASTYSSTQFDFSGWYSGPLQDLQTIIDLNTNEETSSESYVQAGGSNANQIAVARILKVYFYQMMTDRWGMIPYSEALKGEENFTPAYDSQDAIYADLIAQLKTAVSEMDSGQGPTGDFLFNGDMAKWEAFANTLRMRIALRMSEANASTAETEFTAAYNAGILSEDVMYPYLTGENSDNPWEDRFETRTDYAISLPMADTMKTLDDYRLTKFADPAPDADNGNGVVDNLSEIQGMPYGVTGDSAGSITNSAVSFPGQAIRQKTSPLPIFTVAEIEFMLAEASARNWISESASQHYMDGIQASWEQWGVYNAADFAAYTSQSEVAWDASEWRQKIGFQKWIALFPQGYEAWSEWRRLGYPELDPAPAGSIDQIPVRHGYPGTEAELNTESYESAVSSQGADNLTTNVWWDQ